MDAQDAASCILRAPGLEGSRGGALGGIAPPRQTASPSGACGAARAAYALLAYTAITGAVTTPNTSAPRTAVRRGGLATSDSQRGWAMGRRSTGARGPQTSF